MQCGVIKFGHNLTRAGFTIVELVAVMIITAALAITAVAKFDMSATEIDVMSRVLRSNIQFAQEMAMTQGSTFGLRIVSTTSYEIYDGSPGTPATDPLTQGSLVVDISPVTFTTSTGVAFDSDGRPDNVSDLVIGLSDSGGRTRTITISRNTGFVQLSMKSDVLLPGVRVALLSPQRGDVR